MKIDVVDDSRTDAHAPAMTEALERFEASFIYPLGEGRRFRISHGRDYSRFFRSLGEGTCFVATSGGEVAGVIGVALRQVRAADGSIRRAAYFGDLKIAPWARGGRVLVGLSDAVRAWVGDRADCAYGVVMDETSVLPSGYTGRAGIPPFVPAAHFTILRIPTARGTTAFRSTAFETAATAKANADVWEVDWACWSSALRRSTAGLYVPLDGDVALRSVLSPRRFTIATDDAVAELADTAAAKRLYADDGTEMRSAHLGSFAYRRIEAAEAILRQAASWARRLDFPALFVAVADRDADRFCRSLPADTAVTGATVYTYGFPIGGEWLISTCEI
jgi:hypothetical protein